MSAPKMPGGETAAKRQPDRHEDVCGLIEYLNWRREYRDSGRSGQLGMLFCAAFGVDDDRIASLDDDQLADSLIRRTYCYDDFVSYE